MLVSAEIVDPELFRPWFFTGWLPIEEENIRLDPLRVEDTGRQSKQGVDVGFMEQFTANRLASAPLKEDVVRDNNRRPALLLEDRKDVLQKIELFVAGRAPP